jgi:hypothetical protein
MASSSNHFAFRIILDIILLIGLFAMPFWLLAILAFVGLVCFRNFYEFIIIFVFSDLLYAVREPRFHNSVFILTIISVTIFSITYFIKKKIILSKVRNYVS